jgi:UMF1 family MFS transporter
MLVTFLIDNEGIGTIIKMAAIYGAEIGLGTGAMIGSILLVQFIGIPSVIVFFVVGGFLLSRVDVAEGRAVVQAQSVST